MSGVTNASIGQDGSIAEEIQHSQICGDIPCNLFIPVLELGFLFDLPFICLFPFVANIVHICTGPVPKPLALAFSKGVMIPRSSGQMAPNFYCSSKMHI